MAVYAELFDGTRLEFPDGTDPSVISATAKRVTQSLISAQKPETSGAVPDESVGAQPSRRPEDFSAIERNIAAGKRGVESLGDITGGLGLAGTAITGTDAETAAKMMEIKREQAKPQEIPGLTAGDIERIYKQKGLGAAAAQVPSYISEQILQSAPQMAGPLAAGAGATALAAPLGPAAPVVGALVGIGTYGIQQFGNFLTRQAIEKNDPRELSLTKAAMTAGATAPLGYFADRFTAGLGGLGTKKAGEEIIKELSARQVAAKVGKRAAVGASAGVIAEAPLEVLEQAAERWQAGLELTGDEAANEYKEAFFGAAAAGAGIGGASRAIQAYQTPVKPGAPPEIEPPALTPPEEVPPEAPPMAAPPSESQDTQAMIDEFRGTTPPPVPPVPPAPPVEPPIPPSPPGDNIIGYYVDPATGAVDGVKLGGPQNRIINARTGEPIDEKGQGSLVLGSKPPESKGGNIWEGIQNRDRSTPASIAQMTNIANEPDYSRVSMSRDYGTGAPIVAGNRLEPAQLGRIDTVTGSDGKKSEIQYAVVDSRDVIASHNADGTKNPDYINPSVKAFRAVTNGRVAGLQAAYNQGTATDYKNALLSDDLHGIDKKVIEGIENPMLVRVMPMSEINKNTGDISNTGAGLTFNIVEQAKNDTNRLDLSTVSFTDAGDVSQQTIKDFIKAMPTTEQGNLIDKQGNPTKQAVERVDAAIFQQAYGNDKLTELAFQAQDEEARNIVRALNMAASKAIRLTDAGDYDVRPLVNEAVEIAINARRNNTSLSDAAKQADMTTNPMANQIVQMFADNPRSAKAIGENLSNLFDNAYNEGSKEGADMFGEVPKRPVDQLIKDSFAKKVEPDLFAQPTETPTKKPVEKPVDQPIQAVSPEPKEFKIKKSMEEIAAEIGKMNKGSQVSQWLFDNAPNSAARAIAEKINTNINAIEKSGVPISVQVLNGSKRFSYYGYASYIAKKGAISHFNVAYNGLNSQGKAETYPPSKKPTGTRYSTIMHEMLHVLSMVQLGTLIKRNFKGPEKVIYNELRAIYRAVEQKVEEENKLPYEKRHPAVSRSQLWLKDLDELWVRSLTESDLQDFLSTINMGKKTALTKIMEIFRKVVGINPEYQSALDKIMTVSDKIFAQTPQDINRLAKHRGYTFITMKDDVDEEAKPLKLRSDNPGGNWLKENRTYSESKGRNGYGIPNSFGAVTGYYRRNVLVPVDVLAQVKGMRGEQQNVRDDSMKSLMDYMGKNNKLPPFSDKEPDTQHAPFIQVYQDGTPYVNEGNHRIMTAKKLGWKYLPIELRYFNGAETETGLLSPSKIAEYDKQAHDDGFNVANYSAKPEAVSAKKEEVLEEEPTLKTNTPQFKKWFGKSKITNEDGSPMVLYHATAKDLSVLKPGGFDVKMSGPAIWMSDRSDIQPAAHNIGSSTQEFRAGTNVMPLYARIENPLVLDDDTMLDWARQSFANGSKEFPELISKDYADAIKAEGYDGIIYATTDINKKPYNEIIAFESNQLKSSIGNTGEYSTEVADIRYEEVGKDGQEKPTKEARNYLGQPVEASWAFPEDRFIKVPGAPEQSIDKLLYIFQDKQIDLKRAQEGIAKAAGEITDNINAYDKEQLFHGKVATGIRNFLLNELMPAIKKIKESNLTTKDMQDYLLARHAEERNNRMNELNKLDPRTGKERTTPWELQDRASGMSTADARKYLAGLDPAKKQSLETIGKMFDKMVTGTQNILVESGSESQATIDAWNEAYEHYMPLFRVEEDFNNGGNRSGLNKGFNVNNPFSKRAMGSAKEVQNIVTNLIKQRERALIRAEKLTVTKALYGLFLMNPNPDIALPVNPDAIKSKDALIAELQGLGYENAAEIANNLMQEPKSRYISKDRVIDKDTGLPTSDTEESVKLRIDSLARFGDNVLTLRVDGKNRYIFFNQDNPNAVRMATSLKSLDTESLGSVMSIVAKGTRWFANVNTQYNPIFAAVNLIRDIGSAQFNLTTTPLAGKQAQVTAGIFPAMRGIFKILRAERSGEVGGNSEMEKAFREFREEGGQTGYRDALARKESEKSIVDDMLKTKTLSGNALKAIKSVFGALSDFNDTLENSIRLSAYIQASKPKSEGGLGLSKQQAAVIAKNLTVNFDKKGQISANVNALYAFFNASVQGTARLATTLTGPKGKAIIGGGILLGTMQSVLLAAAGFRDDEPPEFVKQRNFIIPTPDGNYLTIPYPLGFNLLPNIGRITTEFMISGGKNPAKRAGDLMGSVADAFSPIGSSGLSMQTIAPTVLDPLAALEANKDAFGRPIYKEDRATNPTPGYLRSRENASEMNKAIAYFFNLASGGTKYSKGFLSPTADELDYVVGQVTGGLGREIMKTGQTIKAAGTGEDLPAYRVPLLGRFYGETESNAAESQRFYNNITRMADHENEIKGRIKNKESVASYYKDNPEARLYQQANTIENQINALNKQKKEFIEKGLPKDRIKRIENQKASIMKRFNDQLARFED